MIHFPNVKVRLFSDCMTCGESASELINRMTNDNVINIIVTNIVQQSTPVVFLKRRWMLPACQMLAAVVLCQKHLFTSKYCFLFCINIRSQHSVQNPRLASQLYIAHNFSFQMITFEICCEQKRRLRISTTRNLSPSNQRQFQPNRVRSPMQNTY